MPTKSESVLARTTKNMGWAALTKIAVLPVTAAAVFTNTHLVVTSVGSDEFGRIMLVGSLFLLLPFADLGLGAVITTYMAKRSEVGNVAAQQVVRRCMKILSWSAISLAAIVCMCSYLDIWATALGLPISQAETANLAVPIAILPFLLSLPLGVGQRILFGLEKNYIMNVVSIAGPVFSVFVTWTLLQTDVPALYLAAATPIGVFVVALLGFVVAIRLAGWKVAQLLSPIKQVGGSNIVNVRVWQSALPMLVMSITVPIAMQSHRIVISHLRPDELAVYSIAAQFYAPSYGIIATIGMSLWPVFSQLGNRGRRLWLRALWMMGAVGLGAVMGYCFVVPPLAAALSEDVLTISLELGVAFGSLLLVMAVHQPSAMLLTSERQLRFQAITTLCMFVLAVGISILITPTLGGSGPVWASAGAIFLCQVIPCGVYAARFFKEL